MLQQWLLLLYILLPYHINSTIKYTSLNPSTSSQNGATITLLKNTTTTSNSQSEWFISSINNIGFHMKLSLDNTWSFHPTYPTSLTIEIDSNSPSTINNTALLLLFSQLNKTYFSTMIQLDKSTDHLIYPKCEIYPNKSSFMHTNINNLSFNNRIQTASMQNKFDSYLLPHTNQPNISYPLTFILKNNPSQNASFFSYFNPISNIRTCAYNTMSINTSIDIYIALAYNLTQLNITSINITYFINDTTIEPTYNPTMEPTIEPTYNPTIEPTLLPSDSPVIITTDKQLCTDCENITNNITSTLTTIIYRTTNIIPTDIQNNKNDNFIEQLNIFGLNNDIFFVLIICIVCVLCLCICLIIVICIKKRKHRKNTKGMKVISNDSQIMNIKSQSTITMDNNINTNGMITKESFDSINKYENNINKSENINNKVTETETVELIELNEDKNNNNNNNVKVKVTVTAYDDDDDDDNNNIDDSSDEKSLYNMNIPPVVPPVPNNNSDDDDDDEKDNNDDSDHSLYRLQHEYLHSEINEIEDEQERELLGNENNNNNNNNNEEGNVIQGMDKITDNGNGITDIGNGITDDGMNKNVYITDNGYNKKINSNESDDNDNDNDLITGITTTGGNDNDMDDENVPPPPMPPPPNDK